MAYMKKRGKNSWQIKLHVGRDPITGKKVYKSHTVRGNKREAQHELHRLEHELATGAYVEPTKITVAEYLERWLAEYAEPNLGGKTVSRYRQIIRNNLTPALGSIPLNKLQPLAIQGYYNSALESGRKDGKGGLSARTVNHCHRLLHTALKQAVAWRMLFRNPADMVKPPRPKDKPIYPPSEEERLLLMQAAQGTRLHMPVTLANATGMRRGEILAGQWCGLDWGAGAISVTRALTETDDGVEFKEPKSRRGRRTISLPKYALDALEAHHMAQQKLKALLGDAYQDEGLICCREDGSVWPPAAFTSAYRDLLRRRNMKNIPFHHLRHAHASHLLKAGVSAKVVSERLGHSSVSFTLDTYAHLLPGMDEQAAQQAEKMMRAALERQESAAPTSVN